MTGIFNTVCYDYDDNTITHFTQGDQGQTLTIRDLNINSAPEFHFCNKNSTETIDVQSTMDSSGNITVDVPDSLLEECETIIVYVYAYYSSTVSKTIDVIKIPVIPKIKSV